MIYQTKNNCWDGIRREVIMLTTTKVKKIVIKKRKGTLFECLVVLALEH